MDDESRKLHSDPGFTEPAFRTKQALWPHSAATIFALQPTMKALALALISAYQRLLSPRKGFRCAFRAHTGCPSCSALGYRAIRMKGLLPGLIILRARLYRCGVAYRRYGSSERRAPLSQRGDCDFGCIDLPFDGDCGGPTGAGKSGLCEAVRCLDVANCDWPTRDKKGRKEKAEDEVHLPARKD